MKRNSIIILLFTVLLVSCITNNNGNTNPCDVLNKMERIDSLHYRILRALDNSNRNKIKVDSAAVAKDFRQLKNELITLEKQYKSYILDVKSNTIKPIECFNSDKVYSKYMIMIMSTRITYSSNDLLAMYKLIYQKNYSISDQLKFIDYTGSLAIFYCL
jgi:hypothetical protein